MKALIHGTRICQIVANDKTFVVHSGLSWVTVPSGTTDRDKYIDGEIVKPEPEDPPTQISFDAFEGRFTVQEWDAATKFINQIDLTTGDPKRPVLIQGLQRVTARNQVDLLSSKTDTFLSILVSGAVINEERKIEILTP